MSHELSQQALEDFWAFPDALMNKPSRIAGALHNAPSKPLVRSTDMD